MRRLIGSNTRLTGRVVLRDLAEKTAMMSPARGTLWLSALLVLAAGLIAPILIAPARAQAEDRTDRNADQDNGNNGIDSVQSTDGMKSMESMKGMEMK